MLILLEILIIILLTMAQFYLKNKAMNLVCHDDGFDLRAYRRFRLL